jgi:hypothetical protein
MSLQVGRYGGQCPSKPLSRKDKIQFWLGFVILGIGLPYLAWKVVEMARDAFLWAVGG